MVQALVIHSKRMKKQRHKGLHSVTTATLPTVAYAPFGARFNASVGHIYAMMGLFQLPRVFFHYT